MLIKIKLVLSFLLLTKIAIACTCDQPNIYLEYYSSKYVFEGEVISKTYSKDSLSYTFTIKINKHYKDGDKPENLSFTWPSEPRYSGNYDECGGGHVILGENYLAFVILRNDKLIFSLNCSNSTYLPLGKFTKESLERAKLFNPLKYHFNYDGGFIFIGKPPFSLTNIDSLIKPYKEKRYLKENNQLATIIMFDVDTKGNVTEANFYAIKDIEYESNGSSFNFFNIVNKKYRGPRNDYEADALAIAKKIKKWEVMRFRSDNKPVNARHYITFSIDKNNQINWHKVVITMN